jgi:hypothetical protein
MKKILGLAVLGLGTWGLSAWASDHPAIMYTLIIIGGIITLAITVVFFKLILRFTRWIFTNPMYLSFALITLGTLTYFSILSAKVGVISCILVAGLLTVMSIRSISHKAKDSKVWNAVFEWLTGYSAYNAPEKVTVKEKPVNVSKDSEIVKYLVELGFTKKEAQEATGYALEEKPDEGLEAQVKCALAYLKPEDK